MVCTKFSITIKQGSKVSAKEGKRWVFSETLFGSTGVFVNTLVAILVTIAMILLWVFFYIGLNDYWLSSISKDLLNYKFYVFMLLSFMCGILFIVYFLFHYSFFEKTNCVTVTNCNTRIGSKYNWDSIIDDFGINDSEQACIFVSKLTDWLQEQDFSGNIEFYFTNTYSTLTLFMETFFFRFELEEDLILAKIAFSISD